MVGLGKIAKIFSKKFLNIRSRLIQKGFFDSFAIYQQFLKYSPISIRLDYL